MNYYLKKRLQNKISRSDMANMLGIDYNKYYVIEKGVVKMPSNLIDKFNEIINKGKQNEITIAENEIKANEFWKEMKKKNENGKYVLVDKMREFNIPNYQMLAQLLGYKSVGTIYNYLLDINEAGAEFKKRLYNFFENELNIQTPNVKEKPVRHYTKRRKVVNKELDQYYQKTNFRKILNEKQLSNSQIAAAVGVHDSVISRLVNKKDKPSYNIIQKVKNYFEAVTSDMDTEVKNHQNSSSNLLDQYISKQKLIAECQAQLEEDNTKIQELQKQIDEIKAKSEITMKFIDLVKNL